MKENPFGSDIATKIVYRNAPFPFSRVTKTLVVTCVAGSVELALGQRCQSNQISSPRFRRTLPNESMMSFWSLGSLGVTSAMNSDIT